MIIVIDTNVLLMALPSKSLYHLIVEKFNDRKYDLVITTEIYFEYEEILKIKANRFIAANILNALIEAPNVLFAEVYYQWNLITADPDDNKFIDAYLTAQADYLVTTDGHFNEAKNNDFPVINIVTPDEFLEIIQEI